MDLLSGSALLEGSLLSGPGVGVVVSSLAFFAGLSFFSFSSSESLIWISSPSLSTLIQPPESSLSPSLSTSHFFQSSSSSSSTSPLSASGSRPAASSFFLRSSSFHFSSSSMPSISPIASSPYRRSLIVPARIPIVASLPRSRFLRRSAPTSR